MIIAHLSDFHISRYGGYMASFVGGRRRMARKTNGWEPIWREDQWRIELRPAAKGRGRFREALRLVSPDGHVHRLAKVKRGERDAAEQALVELKRERSVTDVAALARHVPDREEILALLERDSQNTNVRFCAVAHALSDVDPDWVIITGDLTDDGVGYDLVKAVLAPWIARGRVVAVPGNHDIYATPPFWTEAALRKSEAEKRRLWAAFATELGQPGGGSFTHHLGDGVVLACLDSCYPPKTPASASGLVPRAHLEQIAGELQAYNYSVRLAALHHHVINLPTNGRGLAPLQAGMRLRNAKAVMAMVREARFSAVLNGHRHVGYTFEPAGGPLFVSSPSSTAGCRSGAAPFFWRIDVSADGLQSVQPVPIDLLAHVPVGLAPRHRNAGPGHAATVSSVGWPARG